MKKKLINFISQLSDNEIEEQLENIFEWAKIYKDLLEEEKQRRQNNPAKAFYSNKKSCVECDYDYDEESYESGAEENFEPSETIDYNIARMINAQISLLSVEETEERLSKLQRVSPGDLSAGEKAQLLYEIEACELHLYELVGPSENDFVCPLCGEILEENAKFCGKCGCKVIGG